MSRQSLYNILSNELQRRLEVLDELVSKEDMVKVINKLIQQLINSEFKLKQIPEIVISGLTGYERKEERRKRLSKPRYKSSKESLKLELKRNLPKNTISSGTKRIKQKEKVITDSVSVNKKVPHRCTICE